MASSNKRLDITDKIASITEELKKAKDTAESAAKSEKGYLEEMLNVYNKKKKIAKLTVNQELEVLKIKKRINKIDQKNSADEIKSKNDQLKAEKNELAKLDTLYKKSNIYKVRATGQKIGIKERINASFNDKIADAEAEGNYGVAQKLSAKQFTINTAINGLIAAAKAIKSALTEGAKAIESSMSTSLITNSKARGQAMRYGLSDSSNYALTQTMAMLGMENDEDLMYMNSAQKEKFSEYMEKFSSWYDRMSSTGVLQSVQELQLEFSMFKKELSMKFLEWIGTNKDTIITLLDGAMQAMDAILKVADGILEAVNWIANLTDLNTNPFEYGTSSSSKTVNISLTQSNSASTSITSASELNSYMDNASQSVMQQLSSAIKSF